MKCETMWTYLKQTVRIWPVEEQYGRLVCLFVFLFLYFITETFLISFSSFIVIHRLFSSGIDRFQLDWSIVTWCLYVVVNFERSGKESWKG